MKRSITMAGVVCLLALTAAAQDVPREEVFLGYTYVRFSSSFQAPSFSMNGGGGQFVYNFNHWLGGVADLGAIHNGAIPGNSLDTTLFNFLFGPRFSFHMHRVVPFAQILWGGVYATGSRYEFIAPPLVVTNPNVPIDPALVVNSRISTTQTAFAMTVGGGIDIRITNHISFRPLGVDYYMTRLSNFRFPGDNSQNNLRYTAGLNFNFGQQ